MSRRASAPSCAWRSPLRALPCELVCLGDRDLLAERARALQLAVTLTSYPGAAAARSAPHVPGTLAVAHEPLATPSVAGRLDPANARYVLALLDRAVDGALGGEFDAIVTAPVHKSVINEAGVTFSGHTEYLAAAHAQRALPVMLLTSGELRVALATTHLPLKAVSAALTVELAVPGAARSCRATSPALLGHSPRRASRCAA